MDPIFKPWRSPYDGFSDNPIIYIDPNGDDDYYNEDVKFAFATSTGSRQMIISKVDATLYISNMINNQQNLGAAYNQSDYEKSTESFLLSKSSEIVDNVSIGQLQSLWNNSNPNATVVSEAKEQAALIVLNVSYDDAGKIKASINLEVQDATKNTHNFSSSTYKTKSDGTALSSKSNGIVIGGIHTHPLAGKTIGGKHYQDDINKQKSDVNNFSRDNQPQNFPEYTMDATHYDKITPNKKDNKSPIINDNYRARGTGITVGKDALNTYGKL